MNEEFPDKQTIRSGSFRPQNNKVLINLCLYSPLQYLLRFLVFCFPPSIFLQINWIQKCLKRGNNVSVEWCRNITLIYFCIRDYFLEFNFFSPVLLINEFILLFFLFGWRLCECLKAFREISRLFSFRVVFSGKYLDYFIPTFKFLMFP